MKISKAQLKEIVGNRFFTVTFYKKDGSTRVLNGRLGVSKDVKGTGRVKPDHIVTVYENKPGRDNKGRFTSNQGQYRSFDLNRVISIKTKQTTLNVND